MALDPRLLARAKSALLDIRRNNEALLDSRKSKIYSAIPRVEQIDTLLRMQMPELARLTLAGGEDLTEKLTALRDENLSLQQEKAELLVVAGYTADYLEEIHSCPKCMDSGYIKQDPCSCLEKLYKAEVTKELSALLRRGDECFENFDPSLYSAEYKEEYGGVPREQILLIRQICEKFANHFPDVNNNLLMMGNPGLGKTYLSACIARRVSERGYSVCYDSAWRALEAFEKQRFSRNPEEQEAAAATVRHILSCDLMILDDLGTEFVTPAGISALYTLINTRSSEGRRTVINTVCSMAELESRYTAPIVSRLRGEFLNVQFLGDDIRSKIK